MSKFWAKVRFKQERNAEYLIKAFFKDFNPESSIVVRGKEAKLEIVFPKPPMAIIDAINHCEVIELNYGKNLKEYREDEYAMEQTEQKTAESETSEQTEQETTESETSEQTEQETAESETSEQTEQETAESETSEQTEQETAESETSEQAEQEIAESETSEQTEQETAESETSEQTEQETAESETSEQAKKKKGRPSTAPITISELEKIAEKSSSFEHFATLIAEWLEMDKRQDFFKNLIIVSTEVDKIRWKELEKALKSKKVVYTQWDKIWVRQQISEKLNEYSVTALSFLNTVRQYKDYSFKELDEISKPEDPIVPSEEIRKEEETVTEIQKPRLKMECMPEIKEFEEVLASVDKSQSVENRVQYVLNAMGLSQMSAKEQRQIVGIASTAVRKGRMAFDIIFVEAKIPIEQTMEARMTFAKFINGFVQKYDSSKKVKVLAFLSDLQKIIMYDSEIENFSDFTD